MDPRDIEAVLTPEMREIFSHVETRTTSSVDSLAVELAKKQRNIVIVSGEDSRNHDEAIRILGRKAGVEGSEIQTVITYNPNSSINYRTLLYSELMAP